MKIFDRAVWLSFQEQELWQLFLEFSILLNMFDIVYQL